MTTQLESVQVEGVHPAAPLRGTQSFLGTIARCWRTPSMLGLELLWRWGIGIPMLALLYWQATRILASVSLAHTGISHFSLIDSVGAAETLSATVDALLPPVRAVAVWLIPTLAVAWSLAAGFGRSASLRRYDSTLPFAPWRMAGLQLLRIVVLGGSFAAWFACLHWAALSSLSGGDPDLVGYFVKAIFLSFAVFFFWAAVGWIFSIAPVLAILEHRGIPGSLAAAARFGHGSLRGLRPKLVEINLVLGVVKAALMVLTMVFCASPVPFKAEINGPSLYAWWALVSILYFAASDFFQIARVVGFIELWRTVNQPPAIATLDSAPERAVPA